MILTKDYVRIINKTLFETPYITLINSPLSNASEMDAAHLGKMGGITKSPKIPLPLNYKRQGILPNFSRRTEIYRKPYRCWMAKLWVIIGNGEARYGPIDKTRNCQHCNYKREIRMGSTKSRK